MNNVADLYKENQMLKQLVTQQQNNGGIVDKYGNDMAVQRTGEGTTNLDPFFFFSMRSGKNITAEQIEKEPYKYHAWVHAACWAIAKNISNLPLMLVEKDNPETKVKDQWGILELFESPNAFMDQVTFLQMVILNLLLPADNAQEGSCGGQVFVIPRLASSDQDAGKVNLMMNKFNMPDVLLPFNDNYITPKLSKTPGMQSLEGWMFEVPGHPVTKTLYETFQLIRIHLANPYNWLKGLSSYEGARIAVVQDIKADIYNTRLYDNEAIPSGLLTSEDYLTPEQSKEMLKIWYEEYGNAFSRKTAALGKGLKYQNLSLSQSDMQWVQQKEHAFEKIIASFGLNKIALGKYEKVNFKTIEIGRKLLWTDTYIPLGKSVLDAFNNQWVKYIDPNIRLVFGTNHLEVLREDYTDRIKSASVLVEKMDFPAVLACEITQVPLPKNVETLYPWLAEKPVKTSANVEPEKEDGEDGEDEEIEEEKTFINLKGNSVDKEKFSEDYIKRVLEPGEKKWIAAFIKFFNSQRNRMEDKVDLWLTDRLSLIKTKEIPLGVNSFVLEIIEENKILMKMIRPLVKSQLLISTSKLQEELGELIAWDVTDPIIDQFTAARKIEMQLINTTTFQKSSEKIGIAIEESMLANDTPQETAKRIKKAIKGVAELRKNAAKTIARTETGIVSNTARFEVFKVEGISKHEWVNSSDEKVRDNHKQEPEGAGGEVVYVGEAFPKVGIRYPNDPSGPPEEIINCRCVAVATK